MIKKKKFHEELRLSALLHDIGTFPFSHSIEFAYIRHGKKDPKNLPHSHEHLGSFIIKNTGAPQGITFILKKYGFDPQKISKIIKGESPSFLANQLMHSDLDADRMDYLMRDAYYSGISYGTFDRDYILENIKLFSQGRITGFGVKTTALHALEDFLFARFSWYSQIIRNRDTAKFDIIASHLTERLLEEKWIYSFFDLLELVKKNDHRFFWWNDIYFMKRCQDLYDSKNFGDTKTQEWIKMILFRIAPKTIPHELFDYKISNRITMKDIKNIHSLVKAMNKKISKEPNAWICAEVPKKPIFICSERTSKLNSTNVQILNNLGKPMREAELKNTLFYQLTDLQNFIPSIYTNEVGLKILKKTTF